MAASHVAVFALCLGLALAVPLEHPTGRYNTKAGPVDDKINVHVVCHTHDDVGWLKTVDQYYMGANNSIQNAGVQYILDSVIPQLEANPDRRFIYVEQAFFQRWYMEQDTDMRDRVKRVVANRQLVFINGGWCMHDEAATHYVAMIDQTTLGHRFLVDEFGQFPRIGWQIDPFGHSGTQAALLSAEAGFDGLFFGRLDYQDKDLRLNQSNMETLWRGSPSLGVDAQVFTGALYTGYGPPGGLDWNTGSGDAPIQDDPRLHDVNVKERVNDAVEAALDQANHYRTNHIMWTMGSDFQYSNAETWYKNLDKLIHYGNLDGRVNFFYSTPEEYTDAKNAADLTWSVKDDDYFPYADGPHNFWTGYFTSRAALKRYVRDRTGYLQAARQLEAAAVGNSDGTAALAQALGVAQHHDAVSGTSKQHVAYDYAERIAQGDATAQKTVADSIAKLMGVKSAALTQCTSLNVSVCSAADADNGDVSVIAFNALGQRRFETVALPSSAKGVTVYNGSTVVPSTVMAQFEPAVKQLEHGGELPGPMSPYTVYFDIELEPFAFAVYTIKASEQATVAAEQIGRYDLENDHLAVTFNADTGRMETILNKDSGKTAKMTQDYLWYNSSQGYGQNSGAYIFRPNNTHAWPVNEGKVGLTIVGEEGGVMEARQQWTPWLTQTVRLHPHGRHLEIEWTVGSVPLTNNWGHEIISRFTSDIDSEDTFYTDSNGRDSMKRVRNYRPTWKLNVTEPIAGNYYPVNAFIAIYEGEGRVAAIVTDRSQGGASLESGQFELMVQRRLTADDSRGVGEPLNETTSITPYPNPEREGPGVVIRGVHHLVFGDNTFAAEEVRGLMDRVFSPPVLAFSDAADMTDAATTHHILPGELPANVQLMTLEARGQGQYLVRLSHQYGEHEHPTLSKPATVSLASLFGKVNRVEELTLTANRPLDQLHRLVWKAQDGKTPGARPATPKAPEFNVELTPMKIRTFMVTIEGEGL